MNIQNKIKSDPLRITNNVFQDVVKELPDTIGDYWLSAWRVSPNVSWVQTRSPQFARKLTQRSDSRLVMRGVAGGYLRTFEFRHGLAWARRLITRYRSKNEMATKARKTGIRLMDYSSLRAHIRMGLPTSNGDKQYIGWRERDVAADDKGIRSLKSKAFQVIIDNREKGCNDKN
jgi:hypothetical protein